MGSQPQHLSPGEQLQDARLSVRTPTREISSSFSVDVQVVMVAVEQQVLLRFIQKSLSRLVVQKFRKEMRRQSVRSRDYSVEKKSAI